MSIVHDAMMTFDNDRPAYLAAVLAIAAGSTLLDRIIFVNDGIVKYHQIPVSLESSLDDRL